MNRFFVLATIALLGAAALQAQDYGKFDGQARDTSLVQLIVQPEKYAGSSVRVRGALHWEFEGSYLFLSRDHLEAYDTASAIEVGLSTKNGSPSKEQLEECSAALVMVEGKVVKNPMGPSHYLEITRIQVRDGRRSEARRNQSGQTRGPTSSSVTFSAESPVSPPTPVTHR